MSTVISSDGVLELVDVDDVTDLLIDDQVTVDFVEARPQSFRRTISGRVVEWRVEEAQSVVVEDKAGYRWIVDEHGLVYRERGTQFIGESAEIQAVREVIADGGIVTGHRCENCGAPVRRITKSRPEGRHGKANRDDYRCEECSAGGAIVKRNGERVRSVGPVFEIQTEDNV